MRLLLTALITGFYSFTALSQPTEGLVGPGVDAQEEVDSVLLAEEYFTAYKVMDKRKDLTRYVATLRKAHHWSPTDSVAMKFRALYAMGNAFIFSAMYDSAAHYLNKAYDYDREYDLGKYEGAVADRISVIFYNLNDYSRSLKFAEYALRDAGPKLRAAVFYQIGNTHTLIGQYELAVVAYDSAETVYRKLESPNWWYPLFFSMPALLELNDTAGFTRVYRALTEVEGIRENDDFLDRVDFAKTEFSLTEWERGPEADFVLSEMVLPRTRENESWARRQIVSLIHEKKENWKLHREALYMMLRYYQLVHPDSVNGIYDQILALDKAYGSAQVKSDTNVSLDNNSSKALQNLVGRMGYDMLSYNLSELDYVKSTLRKQSRNIIVQALLLLITGLMIKRAFSIRKARLKANSLLELLKEKEEGLLKELVPDGLTEGGGLTAFEVVNYPNLIVLTSRFVHFGALVSQTPPDELFALLTTYFDAFKAVLRPYGLEVLRIDGDSLVAVGGQHSSPLTPVTALKAAQRMHEVAEVLNLARTTKLSLRIGIHTGAATAGAFTSSLVGVDMWGEVFEVSRALSDGCTQGHIALSQELISVQGPDAVWPDTQAAVISGIPAVLTPSGIASPE